MCNPLLEKWLFVFPLSFGVVSIAIIEIFISTLNIISVAFYESLVDIADENIKMTNNHGNFHLNFTQNNRQVTFIDF